MVIKTAKFTPLCLKQLPNFTASNKGMHAENNHLLFQIIIVTGETWTGGISINMYVAIYTVTETKLMQKV